MKCIRTIYAMAIVSSVILLLSTFAAAGAPPKPGESIEKEPINTDSGITEVVIPGTITGLSLSDYEVTLGDEVTVTVEGVHTCMSWVGTSGADGSTDLSDLVTGLEPLPHHYTFTASKYLKRNNIIIKFNNLC